MNKPAGMGVKLKGRTLHLRALSEFLICMDPTDWKFDVHDFINTDRNLLKQQQ